MSVAVYSSSTGGTLMARSGARRLLLCAGLLAAIQAATHTILFLTAKPEVNPQSAPVVAAMRGEHFNVGMLGSRTYWDFYFGYGLIAVILAFFVVAVIFVAASCTDVVAQRRLILYTATAVAVHAAVIAIHFFVLPLGFDLVVLSALTVSWRQSRRLVERP